MLLFTLPPRRNAKPMIFGPVTPATYITLRRQAAVLSRYEVATRLAARAHDARKAYRDREKLERDQAEALALIDQLETTGTRARHRRTIEVLGTIFALDVDVYYQLANDPADRHPRVCRGCGCSDHDACTGDAGVCSWMTRSICTRCVDRHLGAAEAR